MSNPGLRTARRTKIPAVVPKQQLELVK